MKLGIKILIGFLIIIIGSYLYGCYIAPNLIKTNEYKIKVDNLPDNFNGFKIVHISDILYGTNFNEDNLEKLVKTVNDNNPDIVVLTGDLINKKNKLTSSSAEKVGNILSKIKTTCGKYVINGDNDINFDEWTNIIKTAGFINLNNTYDTIYKNGYDYFLIAGVSTFADKESINNKMTATLEHLNSLEQNPPIYNILLMHEADYIDDLTSNPFDLVLAGHSLGGIVNLPLFGPAYRKDGASKYNSGHYKLENSDLYVSTGLGSEEFKFRLFNKPSINVYRLTK